MQADRAGCLAKPQFQARILKKYIMLIGKLPLLTYLLPLCAYTFLSKLPLFKCGGLCLLACLLFRHQLVHPARFFVQAGRCLGQPNARCDSD